MSYNFNNQEEWTQPLIRAIEQNTIVGKLSLTRTEGMTTFEAPVLSKDSTTWYQVKIVNDWSVNIQTLSCTCTAGRNDKRCKHVAAVLRAIGALNSLRTLGTIETTGVELVDAESLVVSPAEGE